MFYGARASGSSNTMSQFEKNWVDEKVVNFLDFLQVPLRDAAAQSECPQLGLMINALEAGAAMFTMMDRESKEFYKLVLYEKVQKAQSYLSIEDEKAPPEERLSPEKLQMGLLPKMKPVTAEAVQGVCDALAYALTHADHGKLARYITMFGDQAFYTALCMKLDPAIESAVREQMSSSTSSSSVPAGESLLSE